MALREPEGRPQCQRRRLNPPPAGLWVVIIDPQQSTYGGQASRDEQGAAEINFGANHIIDASVASYSGTVFSAGVIDIGKELFEFVGGGGGKGYPQYVAKRYDAGAVFGEQGLAHVLGLGAF